MSVRSAMDITFLLSSLWLSGGVKVVVEYANRLTIRGHHITFVLPGGAADPQILESIDPAVKIIATNSKLDKNAGKFGLLRMSWEMAIAVPKSHVIVATHTPTTAVSFLASRLLGRGKCIWYYMDYMEMFDKRPVERWLLRSALRWHSLAVTFSDACIQELNSYCPGRVINIGLGLDTKKTFHPKYSQEFKDLSGGRKIIFFLGDTRPRKGMADFLSAMEIVYRKDQNIVLWIASKEMVTLQTVVPYELFIHPSDEELARIYSACDVYVSASWYEGFGLPPLESMACGAAVVTTDARGNQEYARDGENCLLVPIKNPQALANAIYKLLSDPVLMEKLKSNGPGTASRYDWDIATNRFEEVLIEVGKQSR